MLGNRVRKETNSFLSSCDVTPLMYLTKRCRPNCGSTSTNRWTWSGLISKAMTPGSILRSSLMYQLEQSFLHAAGENFAAVLGAPNDAIFAAVNDILIRLVSLHHWESMYLRFLFVNSLL